MAKDELGIEINIVESLGPYEYLYRESDVDGSDGKHYSSNKHVAEHMCGEIVRTNSMSPHGLIPVPIGYTDMCKLILMTRASHSTNNIYPDYQYNTLDK